MKLLVTILLLISSTVAFSQDEKQTKSSVNNIELQTSSEDAQAMQLFFQAEKYFMKEKYKKAVDYYKQAIAVDSNFIDAIDNLGTSYRRMFEMDSAIHYFELSLSKMPNNTGVIYNLGLVYLYLERYSEAENCFKNLITLNKADVDANYHLALTYLWSQNYAGAVEWGTKAFELSKENDTPLAADAVYIVCKAFMSEGKKDDAINFYKKAKSKGIESLDAAGELGL